MRKKITRMLCRLGLHKFVFSISEDVKKEGRVERYDISYCKRCGMPRRRLSAVVSTELITKSEVNKVIEQIKKYDNHG